jgi:hypothetical protein
MLDGALMLQAQVALTYACRAIPMMSMATTFATAWPRTRPMLDSGVPR